MPAAATPTGCAKVHSVRVIDAAMSVFETLNALAFRRAETPIIERISAITVGDAFCAVIGCRAVGCSPRVTIPYVCAIVIADTLDARSGAGTDWCGGDASLRACLPVLLGIAAGTVADVYPSRTTRTQHDRAKSDRDPLEDHHGGPIVGILESSGSDHGWSTGERRGESRVRTRCVSAAATIINPVRLSGFSRQLTVRY